MFFCIHTFLYAFSMPSFVSSYVPEFVSSVIKNRKNRSNRCPLFLQNKPNFQLGKIPLTFYPAIPSAHSPRPAPHKKQTQNKPNSKPSISPKRPAPGCDTERPAAGHSPIMSLPFNAPVFDRIQNALWHFFDASQRGGPNPPRHGRYPC